MPRTTAPRITYDPAADALAVVLDATPSRERRTRALAPHVSADYLGDQLMGFEILEASACVAAAVLQQLARPSNPLTLPEAAKLAKRAPRTIRSAIEAGKLPAEKQGRDWIIEEADLWNYLETKSARGRPPANKRAPYVVRSQMRTDEAATGEVIGHPSDRATVEGLAREHVEREAIVLERAIKRAIRRGDSELRVPAPLGSRSDVAEVVYDLSTGRRVLAQLKRQRRKPAKKR